MKYTATTMLMLAVMRLKCVSVDPEPDDQETEEGGEEEKEDITNDLPTPTPSPSLEETRTDIVNFCISEEVTKLRDRVLSVAFDAIQDAQGKSSIILLDDHRRAFEICDDEFWIRWQTLYGQAHCAESDYRRGFFWIGEAVKAGAGEDFWWGSVDYCLQRADLGEYSKKKEEQRQSSTANE